MSATRFHGKPKPLTASSVLEAVGGDLLAIKTEDKLRWADIGEVLGRSEDQAAKYADGSAAMDIVAYAKGSRAWNGRFTGSLERLIAHASCSVDAHQAQSRILRAALAIAEALGDDLTDDEIRANRSALENARDALNGLLARLGPQRGIA